MADATLIDALAAAVLAVALFCAGRLVLGFLSRRPVERDVDVTHVVMGVSMAGMLTGWLSGSWNGVWLIAFAASTCWFAWRARGELRRSRADRAGTPGFGPGGGHIPHLVASVAMVYMLVAMRWLEPASGAAHGMAAAMRAMSSSLAASGTPVLALSVAGLLVLDASISAGRVLLRPAVAVASGASASPAVPGSALAQMPLAPRGTAACTLVMSFAMAYMLVAGHP